MKKKKDIVIFGDVHTSLDAVRAHPSGGELVVLSDYIDLASTLSTVYLSPGLFVARLPGDDGERKKIIEALKIAQEKCRGVPIILETTHYEDVQQKLLVDEGINMTNVTVVHYSSFGAVLRKAITNAFSNLSTGLPSQ